MQCPETALLVQENAVEAHHHEHGSDTAETSEEAHGHATIVIVGDRTAVIEIDPAHRGRNQIKAHLSGLGSSVLTPLEATIDVALPDAGVEPISRPLSVSAQGSVIGDLDLSLAGRWTLALSVLVSDFERVTFRTELIVQEEKAPSSNTQRKKRRWGPAYVCLVMTGLIGGWQEGKPPRDDA
jgi:copper transport protein